MQNNNLTRYLPGHYWSFFTILEDMARNKDILDRPVEDTALRTQMARNKAHTGKV